MKISETKKQIVIDNYFKTTCDVNTSIKEAFTKGFEVGLTKASFSKSDYEARLKADMVAMLTELQLEIEELDTPNNGSAYMDCVEVIQQKIDSLKEEEEKG